MSGQATYLFRIDDVCDQMAAARMYFRLMEVFARHRVMPLVAVIPCNLDRSLSNPEIRFRLEDLAPAIASGSLAVGLHGCHHRYEPSRDCIWRLNDQSEFAGVSEQLQRLRIHLGLAELWRRLHVRPEFFVAPSHSYDYTTLRVLAEEAMAVSDGIAMYAFRLKNVPHIPAQLWSPKPHGEGLWTITIHPQEVDALFLTELDAFLDEHRDQVLDFSMPILAPYIEQPWTRSMKLKNEFFRDAFYVRWHLYRGRQQLARLVGDGRHRQAARPQA